MKKNIVYEKPFVKLYLDLSIPAIAEDWIGQITSDEFKETLFHKLSLYKQYKAEHPALEWITDIRRLRGVSQQDMEWAAASFHPLLSEAGVRKIAFIVAEATYIRLSNEQVMGTSDAKGDIRLCYFYDYPSAAGWFSAS
jgi:hypothetical protein